MSAVRASISIVVQDVSFSDVMEDSLLLNDLLAACIILFQFAKDHILGIGILQYCESAVSLGSHV
jgi:hypothetical protein